MIHDVIIQAANDPETRSRAALIWNEDMISYDELATRISAAAAWFRQRFEPESRVLVALENTPNCVTAIYGATAAGMICVPVDPTLSARSLRYVLADCEPAGVVAAAGRHEQFVSLDPPTSALFVESGPVEGSTKPGVVPFGALLAAQAGTDEVRLGPRAPALILYTTGTTGNPKGVVLSHGGLDAATRHINEFMSLAPGVVELLTLPLTHSFGLGRLRCVMAVRGSVVLHQGWKSPERSLQSVDSHGVTSLGLVPITARFLLEHFRASFSEIAPQLRFIEIGSDFLEKHYKEALIELCPDARICLHYGLTEASRSTFLELHSERQHMETVGRASPDVEIRIQGKDGAPLPPGQPGEVAIRSRAVMLGYWRQPQISEKALSDGWLRTGDIGLLDDEGYLRLVGRNDGVFQVGGLSVAAVEVEAVLSEYPGVTEAAVFAVPAPGVAAIELRALLVRSQTSPIDVPALRKHCLERIESYKVPTAFADVDALPRTKSGKLRRAQLKGLVGAVAEAWVRG